MIPPHLVQKSTINADADDDDDGENDADSGEQNQQQQQQNDNELDALSMSPPPTMPVLLIDTELYDSERAVKAIRRLVSANFSRRATIRFSKWRLAKNCCAAR